MQLTFQRIPNTNKVHVTATDSGPNGVRIEFETSSSELRKIVSVLSQIAPPNFQEQPFVNAWSQRIP